MQSMVADIRKLLACEGLFWDPEHFFIDGAPEAWAALSSDEGSPVSAPFSQPRSPSDGIAPD